MTYTMAKTYKSDKVTIWEVRQDTGYLARIYKYSDDMVNTTLYPNYVSCQSDYRLKRHENLQFALDYLESNMTG